MIKKSIIFLIAKEMPAHKQSYIIEMNGLASKTPWQSHASTVITVNSLVYFFLYITYLDGSFVFRNFFLVTQLY